MLLQIPGVSEKTSEAIVAVYPSINSLYKKLKEGQGTNLLVGIPVYSGLDKVKCIGEIVAKRIIDVLFSHNPNKRIM